MIRASWRSFACSLLMLPFVGGTRARRYGENAHLSSCALLALSSRAVTELKPKKRVVVELMRPMMASRMGAWFRQGVRLQPRYLYASTQGTTAPDASVMTGKAGAGAAAGSPRRLLPGTGKCMMAVFLGPTFTVCPHAVAHSSISRRWRCTLSGSLPGAATSSANARCRTRVPLLVMPRSCPLARRNFASELMKMV